MYLDAGKHLLRAVPPGHEDDVIAAQRLRVGLDAVQQGVIVHSACRSMTTFGSCSAAASAAGLPHRVQPHTAQPGVITAARRDAPVYTRAAGDEEMLAACCFTHAPSASKYDTTASAG